jgi:hypothetical protein
MKRQILRKLVILISFTVFPITVVYLAPAPPIMSLRQGVVNLSVVVLASVFFSGFSGGLSAGGSILEPDANLFRNP